MRIPVSPSAIGAPAVYWLLNFYHDNPQLREELKDNRAVERILNYKLFDAENS